MKDKTLSEVYEAAWNGIQSILKDVLDKAELPDGLKGQIERCRTLRFDDIAMTFLPYTADKHPAVVLEELKEESSPVISDETKADSTPEKPEGEAKPVKGNKDK